MTTATKERLIAAGLRLFSQHGFGQVGLDRVLRQAGLTKTTFYNHFASKEELIREVIGRHESELRDRIVDGVERLGGDDSRERLLAVFDVFGELHADGALSGSLLINAIVEFPSPNDPTRDAAITGRRSLQSVFLHLAERLGVASPERFVERLSILLDGALLNCQVTGSPKTLADGRRLAELLIDSSTAG